MIVSADFLGVMVTIALSVTIIAPFFLIFLWIKEWVKGQLW